jgi:Tfp pilus assembly protein PilO
MAFEQLRGRWESLAPREKRLVLAFFVVAVVCVLGAVWMKVSRSLSRLETQNATAREALRLIAEHQDEILEKRNSLDAPERMIPETAPPLQSYLEGLATQAGNITITDSTERPVVVKGKYRELSVDLSLHGVSLDQLAKFLRLVETSSTAVATQHIRIHPYVSAHDKLDVDLTINAYEKAKATDKPKAAPADPDKSGT